MLLEKINDNTTFVYMPQLDAIYSVINLVDGEDGLEFCRDIYGDEQVEKWRKKYPFLVETSIAIKNIYPLGIWDFILDMQLEGLDLEQYHKNLKDIKPEDFLWRVFDLDFVEGASKETIVEAFTEDKALNEVYDWVKADCESFLAFTAFIRYSERYIDEFFALAEEMQQAYPDELFEKQEVLVEAMRKEVMAGVAELGAFEYSQKVMGKTFRNRGPYERFIFVPSYTMNRRVVRFFNVKENHKTQVMFLSLKENRRNQEDVLRVLKAMGDGTRYQILALLAKEGTMRGMDIAKKVSVATSTVSHHMEQLKESGLITEEQVKNSKYYGLNRNVATELIKDLQKDLGLSE